ncbi:fused MFS/spermidine synthase [Tahibacter amnicola]|uniref:Fused MFS/spermidine synthase n=1 Tax=Tahibacter amnicola TaxID=2976241 RepID=A0ABY6BKS0_9GAMM|nr:fused MFS/spermidine synthase [Tahibacter amnicola]UXI68397.1 fused MFS/spermidine synthase [Tahibacter amnicola]
MSDKPSRHAVPYIRQTAKLRALHFTADEMQSCMLIREPDTLQLEYTRTMMGFLYFQHRPGHIGMVGLGGGSLAKFCHRHLPQSRITVIENNPHVIALREQFLVPPDDDRLAVHHGDGADFVHTAPACFDALLLDAYDPTGVPARLKSQAFFDACRAALTPQGTLVANLNVDDISAPLMLARLRQSFDDVLVTLEDAHHGNRIVFAGPALRTRRSGAIRRPAGLSREAWAQLVIVFARVQSAVTQWRTTSALADRAQD